MSGGGGNAILPAVGAGLGIASLIATGGADAPLVGAELMGPTDAELGYEGMSSILPSLSQAATGASVANNLNNVNNALSPQELQAWNQGQMDSFVQNPNQYAPVASNDQTPLVPVNQDVVSNVPAAPQIPDRSLTYQGQNVVLPGEGGDISAWQPNQPGMQPFLQSGPDATSYGFPKIPTDQLPQTNIETPTPDQLKQLQVGGPQAAGTPWYEQYWKNLTDTSGKGLNWTQKGTLGAAGIATLLALQKSNAMKPNYLPGYTPPSAASYGLGRTLAPNYQPLRASAYGYATGGNVSSAPTPMPGSVPSQGIAPADLMQKSTALPQQLQDLMSQYGITSQQASQGIQSLMGNQPTPRAGASFSTGGVPHLKEGSFVVPADVVSHFGNGSTDAGLKALQRHLGASPIMGHGDGMSDDIHTSIEGKQPARVANGEAIVAPEKVRELGKGSTDAGAKKLYAMMNKVRKARTGTTKQGKQITADKYMPA